MGKTLPGLILIWALAGCSPKPAPETAEVAPPPEPMKEVVTVPAPSPVPSPEPEPAAPLPPPVIPTLAEELKKICEDPDAITVRFSGLREGDRSRVLDYYREKGWQPQWFQGEELRDQAREVPEALEWARAHALDPADYFAGPVAAFLEQMKGIGEAEFPRHGAWTELALTLAVAAMAHDLQQGRLPPRDVVASWDGPEKEFVPGVLLDRVFQGGSVRDLLEGQVPQHPGYQQLRRALDAYRNIAAAGGWQPIDPALLGGLKDRELETGSHAIVPLLRDRLRREGYEVPTPADPEMQNRYDDALKAAVQSFQAKRGLDRDGIVGPMTLEALNVPVEELISKIAWSLERWRWLPADLGKRHILVNVPEFTLRAYTSGAVETEMGVIVGNAANGTWTPIFVDQMEHVIFRPYWNVPRSIIEGEILPEVEEDRGYIKEYNFEIVDRFSVEAEVFKPSRRNIERVEKGELQIRQTAGPYNALGLVKFIFPNHHSVYLHDTNERHLFVHSRRDFSHGCIRVQNPEGLARYALPVAAWPDEKIHDTMYGKEREQVFLANPIPVYIFYLTAFATGDGPAGFFQDLYHYDAKMAQMKKGG